MLLPPLFLYCHFSTVAHAHNHIVTCSPHAYFRLSRCLCTVNSRAACLLTTLILITINYNNTSSHTGIYYYLGTDKGNAATLYVVHHGKCIAWLLLLVKGNTVGIESSMESIPTVFPFTCNNNHAMHFPR